MALHIFSGSGIYEYRVKKMPACVTDACSGNASTLKYLLNHSIQYAFGATGLLSMIPGACGGRA